jgi:nicotinate-nucleotide pyrophosphorylase (carboxylating)
MTESPVLLDRVIQMALQEDLGTGDLTTDLIVPPGLMGNASLMAREETVLAGMHVFCRAFQILSNDMSFEHAYRDGELVPAGRTICRVSGDVAVILKGERTALNFLQRMCGIATMTRRFVEKCGGREVRVVDTRKTAPGLRMLDKYAVRTGGGFNHRFGLYDGILIKDNHIAAAGSITRAVTLAKQGCPHTLNVEVEVEDLDGLREALEAGAEAILLDNMSPDLMRKAVELAGGRVLLEASGGIGLETIEWVAKTGVHIISVGAITHSPRAADISLELERS